MRNPTPYTNKIKNKLCSVKINEFWLTWKRLSLVKHCPHNPQPADLISTKWLTTCPILRTFEKLLCILDLSTENHWDVRSSNLLWWTAVEQSNFDCDRSTALTSVTAVNNFAEANPGHLTKSWLINLVDEWMLVSSVITAVTCYDVLSLIKFFA